jgi:preprotein translocase YajC subunit
MQFIPLVVIMVAMWALLIVPQQRRTKAHRAMLVSLDVGDEVLTSAGLYGTIADFDGDGEPEVGVAGYSGYVVYDTDGTLVWETATTDHSSARTGSSV